MIKKILKQWLITFAFTLMFSLFIQPSFADNYSKKEITLNRYGNSEIIFEEKSFNAVSVALNKVIEGLEVNFGNGWEEVEIHDDGFGAGVLLFSSPTHTVEFRNNSLTSNKEISLSLNIFYYDNLNVESEPDISNLLVDSRQVVSKNFNIISRSEWGADETLRYWNPDVNVPQSSSSSSSKTRTDPCGDFATKFKSELAIAQVKDRSPSGDLLTWPLQYVKRIRKITIHHTDSEIRDVNGDHKMDNRDYKSIVRAIYHYHTISRGWGDIGYNYLIDPLGNIYEGRYGGDKVIGAHALCHNNGSLGIAIIGNYENHQIPEPAAEALVSLVAKKSKQHSIDPKGNSVFRGKKLANIYGHRDVRPTACPGEMLYAFLPILRERVSLALKSGSFRENNLQVENFDYNAEILNDFSNITLSPNERKKIKLRFKNTGKKTWDQNTWLHVALNNQPNARIIPILENKSFVAADLKEKTVAPGKTGTFEVELEAGYFQGNYSFEVAPVVNGRYKVSRSSIFLSFNVSKPKLDYEVVKSNLPKGTVFQGQNIKSYIELKNTGNVTWKNYGKNQITLGTSGPRDRKSSFVKENQSRLGYLLESEVKPGESGRFILDLDVPSKRRGQLIEQFTPVIENVGWLKDRALGFKVFVKKPVHLARIKKIKTVGSLLPGEMVKIELEIENKGDLSWDADNMETTLLGRGIKVFKKRLVPLKEIHPGQREKFDFWIQAPYKEGRHSIFLRSRFNKTPIRGGVARYVINVKKPSLRAQFISQSEKNTLLKPGQEKEISVMFKNTGNTIWRNKGPNAIYLGASNPRDRRSRLYNKDGWINKYRSAVLEETVIKPGETGTFKFKINPENKGIYREGFQLVIENVGWVVGGNVKWIFRVFGDKVKSSTSLSDANLNKKRASIITKSHTTKTSNKPVSLLVTPSIKSKTTTPVLSKSDKNNLFRVRLSYSDSYSKITSDKNYNVIDKSGKVLFNLDAGDEVAIKKIGGNIHVQVGNISKSSSVIRFIPDSGGIMEITTMERRPTWNKKLNDNRFREVMEVRVINGEVAYINELPLEDYIKGLAEVSNSAPFEKQKVIAVLARSYARFYMSDDNRKFPGLPYDGSDDPAVFQRYLGYGVEVRSPNFVGAVAITKDEVVLYDGKVIKTPYFNQSDGRTRSAKEVWGWTNAPYLQSVADPWSAGLTKKGHGVGLSGLGATAQAEAGKSYDEIIKYYYQGVEIEEVKIR